MAMFLIAGGCRITGAQPDGDSIRFTPDDPAKWDLITGPNKVKRNASGAAQLRMPSTRWRPTMAPRALISRWVGRTLPRPTLRPGPLTGHTDTVFSVAYSPDGHRLASTSRNKTVRFRTAVATPQMLCDKLTTNMSHKQWREWISPDPDIGYGELCPGLPIPPD
jgi:WD40 repeat protein